MESRDSSRGSQPLAILTILICALSAGLFLPMSDAWCQQLVWRGEGEITSSTHPTRPYNKDRFGACFATAYLDDDEFVDLLIGAPNFDDIAQGNGSAGPEYGAIYAVFGPITGTSEKVLVYTAELLGQAQIGLGTSIAVVEDYNSTEDVLVLVGMPYWESGNSIIGNAYLLKYNATTGELEFYDAVDGYALKQYGNFGVDVDYIGDFNDDGYGDFIVGSAITDTTSYQAYLYLGGSSANPSTPSAYFKSTTGTTFGSRVFGVGDLDNDGNDDLAIADRGYDAYKGRLDVFLGHTGVKTYYNRTASDITIVGTAGSNTGYHVAGGSDVTGNGSDDLVLATSDSSYNVCIFEGPFLSGSTSWSGLSDADTRLSNIYNIASGTTGRGLSIQHDLDGDTLADLVVGRPGDDKALFVRGGAHLSGVGTKSLSTSSSTTKAVESADIAGTYKYGLTVYMADLTDDGRADLVIGATQTTTNHYPGVVSIYDMSPSRFEERGDEIVGTGNLNYKGEPHSAIFFDYDDDDAGSQRLLVTVQGTSSDNVGKLYSVGSVSSNTGIGAIGDETNTTSGFVSSIDFPTKDMRGVASADFDNDSDRDLIAGAPAGTAAYNGTRLYIQQSTGKFQDDADQIVLDQTTTTLKAAIQNALALSWSDYDRDGQVDLLVTAKDSNGDGIAPMLLRNRVSEVGDFSDVSTSTGIELSSDNGVLSRAVAWGDYDGDDDLDLFIGDENTSNPESRFYENNMPVSRDFTESATTIFGSRPSDISSATWFDVDHNGDPDLLTGLDWGFSQSGLWKNASGTLTSAGVPGDCPCLGLIPVDYDYDGMIELLTLPNASSREMIASRAIPASTGSFTLALLAGTEDLEKAGPINYVLTEDLGGAGGERDGDVELFLGKSLGVAGADTAGVLLQNFFADMDVEVDDITAVDIGPTNNWVGVYLVGGGGNNKAGIGAKVECTYTDPVLGDMTQTQWVDGGSMRGSQRSQVLRFGLGEFDGDVDVTVTWPDGWVQTVSPVDKNQIEVIEDSSDPDLRESTQTGSWAFLANDNVLWTFTWETEYASKRGVSGVEVASTNPGCGMGTTSDPDFLSSLDGDVEYTMEAKLGSSGIQGYKHTLKWERSCAVGCPVLYRMTTKQDFTTVEKSSSWTTITGPKVCPSQ